MTEDQRKVQIDNVLTALQNTVKGLDSAEGTVVFMLVMTPDAHGAAGECHISECIPQGLIYDAIELFAHYVLAQGEPIERGELND